MNEHELLRYLTNLFPDFQASWDEPANCFRGDDGSCTVHGVFAEFSAFFRDRHAALSTEQIAALGSFVSQCMEAGDDGTLANAAATCLVENVAGEPCGRELSQYLTGEASRCWESWRDGTIPGDRPA